MSYRLTFVEKEVEDVAKWLRDKPKEAERNIHFLCCLRQYCGEEECNFCRQGGVELTDFNTLEFIRLDAESAVAELYTAQSGT